MSDIITIYRGDDYSRTITFSDSSGVIDITGYTIFFTVKSLTDTETDDDSALISKTITSHTTPASGITTLTLTDSDTAITPGKYKYDIQMKDASGLITTVKTDMFVVLQDITKRIV